MVAAETVLRLRVHAGLEDSAIEGFPSIATFTWPTGKLSSNLERAHSDLLSTFDLLNREINGDSPSSAETLHLHEVPISLVYAITEIIRMLRECQEKAGSEREAEWFRRAVWRVETAWSAVLAGDIDDIKQHLADEETMRFE